ncbi:MAG: Glyoxylase, beta-lactamase superfamily [Friedmanniella sp.]|nr:Glyoxylase, beta-lactamase superfamily [Friedmanniella sp.]
MSEASTSSSESAWREVAAGVHVLVAEPDGVNLGLVVGGHGAVLIDTGSGPAQGRRVRDRVTEVTDQPLVAVVLTHAHRDHAFGTAAFVDLPVIGHETVAAALRGADRVADAVALGLDPADLTGPSQQIAVATAIDLGGRRVEVCHLGRGHTEGDLVVVVPEADVLFAGDLLESSGPPSFGPDSYPHEWVATLDGVIGLMTEGTRAVPGHGEPVDREFVFGQRGRIAAVSGETRHLVQNGVTLADAPAQGSWPWPVEELGAAIATAYAQLGPVSPRRTLPLA